MNPNEEKEVRELIKEIVLLNALRYNGKASKKPVYGKLLGEYPHFRDKIKEIAPIIDESVEEINALTVEEQKEIVKQNWPETLVEKKIEDFNNNP